MKFVTTKEKVLVFVDYEHWFYSYQNNYHMKPNVEEWIQEVITPYKQAAVYFFGDFQEYGLMKEWERLKELSCEIVHHHGDGNKEYTDFIMLDYMYQKVKEKHSANTVLLFTGDGHFESVVKYMKNVCKKNVIVYGVKQSFNGRLKSACSSYVEMPRYEQEQQYYYQLILQSLLILEKKPGKKATYGRTIQNVSDYNQIPEEKVKRALDALMNQFYIKETMVEAYDTLIKVLTVDWVRVRKEGVYKEISLSNVENLPLQLKQSFDC